ncbi:hypothetical protein D3C80_1809140 [compost metagenome]
MLSVGCDHSHFQTRNPHIEVRHGRGVDEAQPDFFARLEDARPVGVRGLAIHEIGVGIAAHVSQIGWAHVHLSPHFPVRHGS